MSRKWIGIAVAIVAVGGTALATAKVGGGGSDVRPDYATVTVHMGPGGNVAAKPRAGVGGKKKPQVVYLESSAPVPINPADPAAGWVGPYVDLALRGCSKVIDGNVVPSRLDVYSQGTYVASPNEYHALIAIDEESLGDRTPFTINSNLTCLKRVK